MIQITITSHAALAMQLNEYAEVIRRRVHDTENGLGWTMQDRTEEADALRSLIESCGLAPDPGQAVTEMLDANRTVLLTGGQVQIVLGSK